MLCRESTSSETRARLAGSAPVPAAPARASPLSLTTTLRYLGNVQPPLRPGLLPATLPARPPCRAQDRLLLRVGPAANDAGLRDEPHITARRPAARGLREAVA